MTERQKKMEEAVEYMTNCLAAILKFELEIIKNTDAARTLGLSGVEEEAVLREAATAALKVLRLNASMCEVK